MNPSILVIFLTSLHVCTAREDPVVELPTGSLLGRQLLTHANTTYYSFQKIPYATAPLGPLRFRAPRPAANWTGLLDGTVLDVSCYQLRFDSPTDSEDCLFVNVYTPQLPTVTNNVSLPVMFYIHGGAFILGSSILAPPDLFVDNGVLLVTINYRLGPFGFLSTQDETVPGNNGLKDQTLALRWTRDNIRAFGGDPDKVTIFGGSAGAASAGYQLLNPNSIGLFRGAIMESGSCLSPWAYQRRARSIAFGTAAVMDASFASSNDSEALLQFLQGVQAEDLDAAAEQYLINTSPPWGYDSSQGNLFAPVVEAPNPDAFLTAKMYGLLEAGGVLKVPIMMGFNSEEALAFYPTPSVVQTALESWDENPDLIVPDDMQITDPDEHSGMAHAIRDIYTEGEPWGSRLGDGIRYWSDNGYTRPITKHAELYSSFAQTYFYQFSYDGQVGGISVHYDGAESVGHSEEAFYLFCAAEGCSFADYPANDHLTSQRMIKLWTDFAKYQNPTPESVELLQNVTWPRLSVDNEAFLYLDINENLEIRNHPKGATVAPWNGLYRSLNFTDFDTY